MRDLPSVVMAIFSALWVVALCPELLPVFLLFFLQAFQIFPTTDRRTLRRRLQF